MRSVTAAPIPAKTAVDSLHARQRNVRVDIAAAEKGRRAGERAWVVGRLDPVADETARQRHDAAISARIARGELQRQTRALAEAQQDQLFERHPALFDVGHQPRQHGKRGRQVGLVRRDRGDEALRVPDVTGGIGCEIGEARPLERRRKAEDILGAGAAPVHHDHRRGRAGERRSGGQHRDVSVGIVHSTCVIRPVR